MAVVADAGGADVARHSSVSLQALRLAGLDGTVAASIAFSIKHFTLLYGFDVRFLPLLSPSISQPHLEASRLVRGLGTCLLQRGLGWMGAAHKGEGET